MRICLASSEHSPWGGIGHEIRSLAVLLGSRHEVTFVQVDEYDPSGTPQAPLPGVREISGRPSPDLARLFFSCDAHRESAALLEAIEQAYGDVAPDYLEVTDYRANGLVPLQARSAGHPLLRDTLIGVRVSSTAELLSVHDGTLYQPGIGLVAALEREQLRLADRLVWRGGDTLDMYRRYYSDVDLPEAVRVPAAFDRPATPPIAEARDVDRPLEILFVGRLQRCKGALDLVEACLGLDDDNWRLTMIGADTATAPVGQSVRMTIETMCGDDPRVNLVEPMPHEELQRRWMEHDLLVVASTLEVYGNVVVEAMRAGLPVLTTPVGGPVGIVKRGVTGWHTNGLGAEPIRRALSHLLANRGEVERVRASGAVYARFLQLTDPDLILERYDRMLTAATASQPRRVARSDQPLVTAVVPYYRSSDYIEEAVDSLLGQSHRNLEVMIVNDGSFEEKDEILDRLVTDRRIEVVTKLNGGESSARNLGICLARGEYVTMLDADNVLEKDFVARALETLRSDLSLAYVTCRLRFILPDGSDSESGGYVPLGNRVVADDSFESSDSGNWDGDTIALFPRRIFSVLGYRYEQIGGVQSDWELYRHLREDGRFGTVIPELLIRYRVRPASVSRSHELSFHHRAWNEVRSRRRKRQIRWIGEK